MNRTAEITRKTKETDITAKLDLDQSGTVEISTGIGFLDHMLTALASLSCSACDMRSAARYLGFAVSSESTRISLGPAIISMSTVP